MSETYVANLWHTLMDDLDDPFQFGAVELPNRVAELLLLLEGEDVIVRDGTLGDLLVPRRSLLGARFGGWFRRRCNWSRLLPLLLVLVDACGLFLLQARKRAIHCFHLSFHVAYHA